MPKTLAEAIAHFHAGSKINEETPDKCLEWTRGMYNNGYGHFWYKGKDVLTHRLAFELFHGRPIAEGMHILHSCDNQKCVKPKHLREGTNQDNSDDKVSRNRQSRVNGESHGNSKLTETQVLEIREKYSTLDNCTQTALGIEYGVHNSTISDIINKKRWNHI